MAEWDPGKPVEFATIEFKPSLEHVINELEEVKKGLGRSVMQTALRKAAKPMKLMAQAYAPVDTGLLRRSINVRSMQARSKRTHGIEAKAVVILATAKKTGGKYARYKEGIFFHTVGLLRTPLNPYIEDAAKSKEKVVMDQFLGEVEKEFLRRWQKVG